MLATGYVVLLVAVVVDPAAFAHNSPTFSNLTESLSGPSAAHWFGTDMIGRDVYSRVVYGARYSLFIGLGAMAVALAGGLLLGLVAGLFGRILDEVATRIMDVLGAFPSVLLALLIVASTRPGVANVAVAVGIATIPRFGRVIRGQALVVRRADYVRHAVIFGQSRPWVTFRHVTPNVLSTIPVLATLDIGLSIMASSGLSFLGLGPKPPTPEWGMMLAESRNVLQMAWWTGVFPGVVLTLTVIAFTVLGRHVQHRLDAAR
jgi:peptide/nickel transport system permease protein